MIPSHYWQPIVAGALTAAFVALLAANHRLRAMREEFGGARPWLLALLAFFVVLVATVFYPTVAPGAAADVDTATLWFPTLFIGHLLLLAFLWAWWSLAWPQPLTRFLRLEAVSLVDVLFGLRVGAAAWILALVASAIVTALLAAVGWHPGGGAAGIEIPELLLWLAELPLWRKLVVIAVAMTVEEFFYRAFLQPRVGWLTSSVLFALSHAGYGLPNLLASVFVVSLAIGWAFRRSGSLVPCIVAHGVFDAVQLLIVMPLAVDQLRRVT